MFLEDDNLFILILIALGIYLIMDGGWLEVILMYVGIALVLLNGLEELPFKLSYIEKINSFQVRTNLYL